MPVTVSGTFFSGFFSAWLCWFYLIKILPVISLGTGSCITDKMVGAISPNLPESNFPVQLLSITNNGTKFKVCAVFGVPSSLTP